MKVLIVAPHADDEVLGLGGTMAKHVADGDEVVVAVVTGHGPTPHPLWPLPLWATIREEAQQAHRLLGVSRTRFLELPAVLVPDLPVHTVTACIAQLLSDEKPEVLYVPFVNDLHRDHRDLAYACAVAWRPTTDYGRGIRRILMYETVSETHWSIPHAESPFTPTVWVDIAERLDRKCQALACYRSQMHPFPHSRSIDAIRALAAWRGSLVGLQAAEAFMLARLLS